MRSLASSPSEDALKRELEGVTLLGIRSRTRITRKVLESAPELQAIGAFCIGTNQVDLEACSDHGVIVFNAPFANTRSVVELAIGEMLMLARRAFDKAAELHRGLWDKSVGEAFEVRERRSESWGTGILAANCRSLLKRSA